MNDPSADPGWAPPEDRRRGWSPSLGLRALALAVFGLALPLAGAGIWLVRGTVASGEAFLQDRLERSLGDAVRTMGQRWVGARGRLLDLAEDAALVALLQGESAHVVGDTVGDASATRAVGPGVSAGAGGPTLAWTPAGRLGGMAMGGTLFDREGRLVGTFGGEGEGAGDGAAGRRPALPVRFPVRDPGGGEVLGTLEVAVLLDVLLPGELWWPGVAGSLLALLDPDDGSALVPLPLEAELLARDRFTWGGAEWTVARHRLFDPPVVLALAAPVDPITAPLLVSARRGAGVLALVFMGGVLLVLVSLRRTTRPLRELAGASDAVARGELERRVREEGPDELRRLARAFNAMTTSLRATLRQLSRQEAVAAVGEFAATLAHEIRNPLSAVRLDLERVRRRTDDPEALRLLDQVVGEVERLDTTVRGALGVARSGALAMEPVELRRPLEAALQAARPAFRDGRVTLEPLELDGAGADRGLRVVGNASALEQLFLNLLLNAAQATGSRGRAGVRVGLRGRDRVRVTIWDDGPGIPAELREQVFEPFFSTRSDGTGLGLAVARRIARAHGGDLTVSGGPGGRGARLHLELPSDDRYRNVTAEGG